MSGVHLCRGQLHEFHAHRLASVRFYSVVIEGETGIPAGASGLAMGISDDGTLQISMQSLRPD